MNTQVNIKDEVAEKYAEYQLKGMADKSSKFECVNDFIAGANYMAEKMYSEEEVLDLLYKRDLYILNRDETKELELPTDWFEQFKKK